MTIDDLKSLHPDAYRVATEVTRVAAALYHRSAEDFLLQRTAKTSSGRHMAYYIIRKLTDLSLPEIGTLFGRHHTSVLVGIRRIEKRVQTNPEFAALVSRAIRAIDDHNEWGLENHASVL